MTSQEFEKIIRGMFQMGADTPTEDVAYLILDEMLELRIEKSVLRAELRMWEKFRGNPEK